MWFKFPYRPIIFLLGPLSPFSSPPFFHTFFHISTHYISVFAPYYHFMSKKVSLRTCFVCQYPFKSPLCVYHFKFVSAGDWAIFVLNIWAFLFVCMLRLRTHCALETRQLLLAYMALYLTARCIFK